MTELQQEVEELRKLIWALTKKISDLAARLNTERDYWAEMNIARPPSVPAMAPDDDDKGSD